MVSLCQQPSAGHVHVIILKALGLPPPKSEAPGGLGKVSCLTLITLYKQSFIHQSNDRSFSHSTNFLLSLYDLYPYFR